jgi:ribosomal protein S18 acetylase RimI-like enzyme
LAETRVEPVAPGEVTGRLRREIVELHAAAHGRDPDGPREAVFGNDTIARHSARIGYSFVGAFDPGGRLAGFAYGYTGAPGQWWHDHVALGLSDEERRHWLEESPFELCEIAVRPDRQGTGVGGRLHDALLAGRPEPRALLSTAAEENEDVIAFYERRGWQIVLPLLRFPTAPEPYCVLGREPAAVPLPA